MLICFPSYFVLYYFHNNLNDDKESMSFLFYSGRHLPRLKAMLKRMIEVHFGVFSMNGVVGTLAALTCLSIN